MPITGIFDRTLGRVISMQEAWERAVEAALGGGGGGGGSPSPPRSLTLDGAVKCIYGQLHPLDRVLDRFQSLEHLSIANIGVSSLEKFPRLRNLQRLILSDNRISGGLEFLVGAGLESLRDLDLSNNRIQTLEDLAPLARLRLVSLDLYECPVTRVADYRVRVFALISSLKYLDKLDSDGNERPESDDEDDDDEEDDEEEEEEDPGSGEVDGEEKVTNGVAVNGIIDADEDDESDADEEETARPTANGSHHVVNGFRVVPVGEDEEDVDDEDFDEDDVDGDDDGDQGEEIDEDDGEDDDVVEVHDISDSDDGDGVEAEEDLEDEDDEDEVEGDGDEDEEDVEDEEGDGEPGSSVRMMSTDGEIDGHEHGEGEGEEDDTGEIGEEDEGVEEDEVDLEEEEEDDLGDDYHVQPHVVRAPVGEFEACNGEDEDGVEDDDNDEAHHVHSNGPSASLQLHPCNGEDEDGVEDDNEDFPQQGEDDGPSSSTLASKRKRDAVSDDDVEDLRSSKQR